MHSNDSMTDLELLELAAKAAGLSLAPGQWWNPLEDDGDAFRLAVKLKLDISWFLGFGEVRAEANDDEITNAHEQFDADPYAATRRAIVRAAAEISKSKGA